MGYQEELNRILQQRNSYAGFFDYDTAKLRSAHLLGMRNSLRLLKREVKSNIKSIRLKYDELLEEARTDPDKSVGQARSKHFRVPRPVSQEYRKDLESQRALELKPHEEWLIYVSKWLNWVEKQKIDADRYIERVRNTNRTPRPFSGYKPSTPFFGRYSGLNSSGHDD